MGTASVRPFAQSLLIMGEVWTLIICQIVTLIGPLPKYACCFALKSKVRCPPPDSNPTHGMGYIILRKHLHNMGWVISSCANICIIAVWLAVNGFFCSYGNTTNRLEKPFQISIKRRTLLSWYNLGYSKRRFLGPGEFSADEVWPLDTKLKLKGIPGDCAQICVFDPCVLLVQYPLTDRVFYHM